MAGLGAGSGNSGQRCTCIRLERLTWWIPVNWSQAQRGFTVTEWVICGEKLAHGHGTRLWLGLTTQASGGQAYPWRFPEHQAMLAFKLLFVGTPAGLVFPARSLVSPWEMN